MNDWMKRPFQPSTLPTDYFHRPSPARMWNYLQGGDDNFSLDRASGDAMASDFPDMFYLARQSRRCLMREVRYLAAESDVHQFLDLGCGLPAPHDLLDVHDVAQDIHRDARVVYVDNDKVVISHADALLTSRTPEGKTDYIEADVRNSAQILDRAADTLDFDRPVAVLMSGILGQIPEYQEAITVVTRFLAATVPGSYLSVHDGLETSSAHKARIGRRNATGINPYHLRSLDQFRSYFEGLELVEPGIVSVTAWRPEPVTVGTLRPVPCHAGLGRKVAG
jgi:hypothetical protein